MKKYLFLLAFILLPLTASAQLNGIQGGTGVKGISPTYIPYGGSTTLRIATSSTLFFTEAANRLSFTFGSSTAYSATNINSTFSSTTNDISLSATTTSLGILRIASTSLLTVSAISGCSGSSALTTNSSGVVACGSITSSAGAFPFTPTTNFGALANATGTPIWFQSGFQASSTSQLVNASSTLLTVFNTVYLGNSTATGIDTGFLRNVNASVIDGDGGSLEIDGGLGLGAGQGGALALGAGDGGATGDGGAIEVISGEGGASGGDGGSLTLRGGDTNGGDSNGGAVQITSGNGFGTEEGGTIEIIGGNGGATGVGGNIQIQAGVGGASSGNGGTLALIAGSAQAGGGSGGDLSLTPGTKNGGGSNGSVFIQDPTSAKSAVFTTSSLTADRSYLFPDTTGTFCLTTTCAGFTFPFTVNSNFGALTMSTSTPLWFTVGFQASSTSQIAFASTTAISASGALYVPSAANPIVGASTITGTNQLAIDSTAASSSLHFYDGTAERALFDVTSVSFAYSTTSPTGTTTLTIAGPMRKVTYTQIGCSSTGGTANIQLGNGTASTTMIISAAGLTTTYTTLSSNNSFGQGISRLFAIGTFSSTGVTNVTCTLGQRYDPN